MCGNFICLYFLQQRYVDTHLETNFIFKRTLVNNTVTQNEKINSKLDPTFKLTKSTLYFLRNVFITIIKSIRNNAKITPSH